MHKKRRRFRGKLKYKYVVACISLNIFVISILTGSYYGYFNRMYERQTQELVSSMSEQTKKSLQLIMEQIDSVILNIQSEGAVQDFLRKVDTGKYNEYEEYLAREAVRQEIYADILWEDLVSNVYLESEEGHREVWEKVGGQVLWDTEKKTQIYEKLGRTVWLGLDPSGKYVQAGAQVNSVKDMKPLGFVIIQIPVKDFENQISQYAFVRNGITLLVNQDGEVIIGTEREPIPTYKAELQDFLKKNEQSGIYSLQLNRERHFAVISDLDVNEWKLITLVPKITYNQVLYDLRFYVLLIVAGITFVTFIIILIQAERFTGNIKELQKAMERFGEGDFNVICAVRSDDEVGQLSQHFNMMVYNINDLIDKVYNETMLRQEAELKSLRMQINPHFLYNTLDMMSWISREKGAPEVGEVAISLGNMLRYAVKGPALASIGEELEHIKNYFVIQRYRYGERLRFEIKVPDDVLQIKIPRLLIQPLIENAIIHGVENLEADGIVKLLIHKDTTNIYISVVDNGIGMAQERIHKILCDNEEIVQDGRESIGLKNVNRRLKIRYGETYGLRIESVVNKGTKVAICIPLDETEC